jgi:hypothetical protein
MDRMSCNNSERIRELREILRGGIKRIVVDGVVTEYDLDVIRQELARLMEEDAQQRSRRPRAATINLGDF